jgi:pimeloyl-ACP methyl ester carboxylesterase
MRTSISSFHSIAGMVSISMATLKSFLILALVFYGGLVALLYFAQRSLQYFPERQRTLPAAAGLPEAQEAVLDTADGERVIVWHVAPRAGKPVIIYFHGNGASLRWRVDRFRALTADGSGLIALSYRGYGGSSGSPTEAGLVNDGRAAYDFARERYPAERIVLWGESLGSAVAVALAAEKPVGQLVLEAPFSSAADVGAAAYWFVPVRWLMKDQFRSDLVVGKVTAPVLVLHGERDAVVPIALGERLYDLINSPKQFVRFPGSGHNDLGPGAVQAAKQFLRERSS